LQNHNIDKEKEHDIEYQIYLKERYKNLFLAYKEISEYQRELCNNYKVVFDKYKISGALDHLK